MSQQDAKAEDDAEEKKWEQWERIQKRMASREQVRKPPRALPVEKKKKLIENENAKWKENFSNHTSKQQQEINQKYNEMLKEKEKKEKEQDIEDKKNYHNKNKNKSNSSSILTARTNQNWKDNLAAHQRHTSNNINSKYKNQNQNQNQSQSKKKDKNDHPTNDALIENSDENEDDLSSVDAKDDTVTSSTAATTTTTTTADTDNNNNSNHDNNHDNGNENEEKKNTESNVDGNGKEKRRIIAINGTDNPISLIKKNDLESLKTMYEYYPTSFEKFDKANNTVLHTAARYGYHKILVFLIPKLPNNIIQFTNHYTNNALIEALMHDHYECFETLLNVDKFNKQKFDLNYCNMNGRSVMHIAILKNKKEYVSLLLKQDPPPNINLQNKSGETPLMMATKYKFETIVEILLTYDPKIGIKDLKGDIPDEIAKGPIKEMIKGKRRKDVMKGITLCDFIQIFLVPNEIIETIVEFTY